MMRQATAEAPLLAKHACTRQAGCAGPSCAADRWKRRAAWCCVLTKSTMVRNRSSGASWTAWAQEKPLPERECGHAVVVASRSAGHPQSERRCLRMRAPASAAAGGRAPSARERADYFLAVLRQRGRDTSLQLCPRKDEGLEAFCMRLFVCVAADADVVDDRMRTM